MSTFFRPHPFQRNDTLYTAVNGPIRLSEDHAVDGTIPVPGEAHPISGGTVMAQRRRIGLHHRRNTSLTQVPVAVLRGDSNVKGTVTFEQADESSNTTISWNITGHDANAERGMHVHAFGDNTNGCTSAGPHCTFDHTP
jgi:Cu/Zn superoxide dismutase